MRIECKRTTELSDNEIQQYCDSFGRTFPKHKREVSTFKTEYLNSSIGYSFHILLKNDLDEIVGGYSATPFLYEIDGRIVLIASGADFMIERAYRNNIRNVVGLIKNTENFLKENNVVCLYGFPNEISYRLNITLMKMNPVTPLNIYLLPMRIGDANRHLKFMNPISYLGSKLLLLLSYMDCQKTVQIPKIHPKRPEFDNVRYKWYNPDYYNIYIDKDFRCVWKHSQFEGVKACFLMDVYPLSKRNFNKAVREMVKREQKRSGLFIYVGNLQSSPWSMIKIPKKVQPKKFRFVAKVLDNSKIEESDVLYGKNWNLNLSSYDLI